MGRLSDFLFGPKHAGQHAAGKHTKTAKVKAAKQPRLPKGKGKGGSAAKAVAILLTPPVALLAGAAGFAARTVL